MGGLIARIKFDRILTIFLIQFYSNVIHLRYIKSFTMSQQLIFINNNLPNKAVKVESVTTPQIEPMKQNTTAKNTRQTKKDIPVIQEDAPAVKNSFNEEE